MGGKMEQCHRASGISAAGVILCSALAPTLIAVNVVAQFLLLLMTAGDLSGDVSHERMRLYTTTLSAILIGISVVPFAVIVVYESRERRRSQSRPDDLGSP
jgi:hypothetical protein